ncbi:MAG: ATP-dependent sacrificial sulfur transferase LarE [Planctomycetaceae bacterium]|nr:ATP-dependent sacrificial sulfur transferase LarE [Planctomycetaceae bacterium]
MERAHQLVHWFSRYPSCLIAFSGGVDSAVVARAASEYLGDKALAVTGVGPAVAQSELKIAADVAKQISICHEFVTTHESEQEAYRVNDLRRCYHCKTELYGTLVRLAKDRKIEVVVSGTNADDLGDYRPGLQAAAENAIQHPLAELGFTKAHVRELAHYWGLSVADKPASPCLASRIAYGVEVTPERLKRVELAEAWLAERGLREFRVRVHQDELARLEITYADLAQFFKDDEFRRSVAHELRKLGFNRVTVDLEGFCSGSLYQLKKTVSG